MDNSTHTHTVQWMPLFTVSPFNSKSQTVTLIVILVLLLVLLLLKIIKRVQRYRKTEFISPQILDQGRVIIAEVLQDIMTQKPSGERAVTHQPIIT